MTRPQPTFRSALKWSFVMTWGGQGFGALITFILAAMLGPRAFGTVAMALAFVALVEMVLEQGLTAALVQRRDLREEHLDSVFWVNLGLGAVLTALCVALSGWWADLNNLPDLAPVIQALSLMIPLRSLTLVQESVLQREMNFKSLSVRSNVSVLAGGLAGITAALGGWGVWALVAQKLVEGATSLVLLWSVGRWRPRWRFSLPHLREIMGFSSLVFVGSLGSYLSSRADALLIGLFFGEVTVGLYRLAQRLMDLVVTLTTRSLTGLALPHLARSESDPDVLRGRVLMFFKLSATLTLPAMACVAACAPYVVPLLGPKWQALGPALVATLRLLCVVGAVSAVTLFTRPLMNAVGKPHLSAMNVWIIGVASVIGLALAGWWADVANDAQQAMAAATSRLLVAVLVIAPLSLWQAKRAAKLRIADMVATVAVPLAASLAAILAVLPLTAYAVLAPLPAWLALFAAGCLAGWAAAAVLLTLDAQARALAATAVQALLQRPRSVADKV